METMKGEITLVGRLTVTPEYDGEPFSVEDAERCIETGFSRTLDELLKLDVEDPSVTGSITTGDIEITVTVTGTDAGAILNMGELMIRTAMHAAEIGTAMWEDARPLQFQLLRRELVDA